MQTNILAVTGNPVLHSLSPVLMNGAIKANNLQYRYLRLPANSAEEAIKVFKLLEMKGMNVTAPFKQDVIPFLDQLTDNAKKAGAVNCVYPKNGVLCGDNTDITGVEICLKRYPKFLKDGKMLVVGSGGATQGVIIAGQNLGLKVTVAARNQEALHKLQESFGVMVEPLQNIENIIVNYKIIVQALPSGVKAFDPELLTKDCLILDANYKDSIFEPFINKIGFKFLSGKDWLVNQAVPAFETFTGSSTSADTMYQALQNYTFKYSKRIALTGFMGVGKTTSGKILAKLTGYRFVDMDDEIEAQEGMKITEIFKTKGEDYFRKIETDMLRRYAGEQNIILSCGGGTVKNAVNQEILRNDFVTIWLYATARYCIDGLDISNRPLLQCDNPLKAAETMLSERIPFYASCAYAVVSVENLKTEQIAQKVYEQISRTFGI